MANSNVSRESIVSCHFVKALKGPFYIDSSTKAVMLKKPP